MPTRLPHDQKGNQAIPHSAHASPDEGVSLPHDARNWSLTLCTADRRSHTHRQPTPRRRQESLQVDRPLANAPDKGTDLLRSLFRSAPSAVEGPLGEVRHSHSCESRQVDRPLANPDSWTDLLRSLASWTGLLNPADVRGSQFLRIPTGGQTSSASPKSRQMDSPLAKPRPHAKPRQSRRAGLRGALPELSWLAWEVSRACASLFSVGS
jgi:hypothetical protein